ncbi:MAG: tRNA (adenosine(37)-N6)-threonylcarbamoyltransferase complex dimerization subunit type 1 TsaB [Solirubrobacteraceae bacterium]|jgi:tRNA threonylcarbamoyladenosine biosynthesis protein TsaB
MVVLGFDTSTSATAAALRLADGSTTQARDDPPAGAHPGHATRLLEMAHELLAQAGIGWSAIDRIAVGVGPGTFTGLRVGVATARGLAQSLSAEIVGVSSPRALALVALAREPSGVAVPSQPAQRATVLAVIDARRGEVFAAAYETGDQDSGAEGMPRELVAPAPLPPQELASIVTQVEQSGGAQRQWLAVGDGALRYREQLELAGIPMPPDCSPLQLISAAAVCELGARAAAVSLHAMLPDYRRRPDAELALVGTDGGPLR